MKSKTKETLYYGAGFFTGLLSAVPVHESGHWIVDYLLGGNPTFGINELDNFETRATSYALDNDPRKIAEVFAGGPAANYMAAIGLAGVSKKIKNTYAKEFIMGASLSQAIMPLAQALAQFSATYVNYKVNAHSGDFNEIIKYTGIPYSVIIPATALALLGISRYLSQDKKEGIKTKDKNDNP